MKRMENLKDVRTHLDRLTQEISEIKKILIKTEIRDKKKTEMAWKDLMEASKEISRLWQGPSAVGEIKAQREKMW